MALTNQQRIEVAHKLMQDASAIRELYPIAKTQVKACVDAVDDWLDANLTSLNNALPVGARAALSANQKQQLLLAILRKRFN